MNYRSFTLSADWFRVTWDVDRPCAPADWTRVVTIPGVRYQPRGLEIPRTAWGMSEVIELCAELGVTPPRHADKYAGMGIWQPWAKPLAHQPAVSTQLLEQHRVLLADQLGLGKTRSAIQAAETVRRHVFHCKRPVLILGPKRVRTIWFRELLATGAIESTTEFCALVSEDLNHSCWVDDAAYYFVHYDVVHEWWPRFTSIRPCVTLMDEAQYLKNIRSRRTRNTAMVAHIAPFRIAITGTPIDNKPKDLYAILDLLNGPQTWGSINQFRVRYCGAVRDAYGYTDTQPTNTEELRARLAPFYIRREIEDTGIELPPFQRELLEVEVPANKQVSYQQHTRLLNQHDIQKLVSAMCTSGLSGDTLRTLNDLRQITCEAKMTATLELAGDVLESDGAVVIFTWQRSTAQSLQRMLGNSREAITGALTLERRDALIDQFQAKGGALVATYGALQDAVTLHRSRVVILHDLDYVPKTMLQAEKRVHRIGQLHGCKSYWMVAPQFFDRIILTALRQKCADIELVLSLKQQIPELVTDELGIDSFTTRMEESIKEWRQWNT